LRGYEVIHIVLTEETSTAEQTWLQQVVIKISRQFRALQLQVKQGERKRERERVERERERERERESRERERERERERDFWFGY
jgi:hypothetical protein